MLDSASVDLSSAERATMGTRANGKPMKAIELVGHIDEQHRLRAEVPEGFPTGPVRLIVLFPDEDGAGIAWASEIAKHWVDELGDSRQDIYTLEDGRPVNAAG